MIERPLYMQKIEPFFDSPFVKILTGIRRSGKSTILEAIAEKLKAKGINNNRIIFINFDSLSVQIENGTQLYNVLREKIKSNEKYYFLLDEIQEVFEWEKAINSLMIDANVDIYVTGSNSKLMSSEISTYLTGRYVMIQIFPLSFAEFIEFGRISESRFAFSYEKLNYKNFSYKSQLDLLDDYIRLGGFPVIALKNYSENETYTIIHDIYNSIVLNDIVRRNNIRKVDQFERVVKFLFENVGKTFSAHSVANYMKSEKRSIDVETVYNYIDMLKKSYIIYQANRYDIQGKEIMKTQEKYFLADQSLKYSILGFSQTSVASMLENIVFLELKRRGYEVFIGNSYGKEVDFVGINKDEKIYIQVCRNIPETEEGKGREIGNLQRIKDHFPKFVVTLDKFAGGNIDGIKIIHLADFLLGNF